MCGPSRCGLQGCGADGCVLRELGNGMHKMWSGGSGCECGCGPLVWPVCVVWPGRRQKAGCFKESKKFPPTSLRKTSCSQDYTHLPHYSSPFYAPRVAYGIREPVRGYRSCAVLVWRREYKQQKVWRRWFALLRASSVSIVSVNLRSTQVGTQARIRP